jgi:hypothetical protein
MSCSLGAAGKGGSLEDWFGRRLGGVSRPDLVAAAIELGSTRYETMQVQVIDALGEA